MPLYFQNDTIKWLSVILLDSLSILLRIVWVFFSNDLFKSSCFIFLRLAKKSLPVRLFSDFHFFCCLFFISFAIRENEKQFKVFFFVLSLEHWSSSIDLLRSPWTRLAKSPDNCIECSKLNVSIFKTPFNIVATFFDCQSQFQKRKGLGSHFQSSLPHERGRNGQKHSISCEGGNNYQKNTFGSLNVCLNLNVSIS